MPFQCVAKGHLLDTSRLCDATSAKLIMLADTKQLNLGIADADVVSRFILPLCLPADRLSSGEVMWNNDEGQRGSLSRLKG